MSDNSKTTNDIVTAMQATREKIRQLQINLQEESKKLLKEGSIPLFQKYPALESFGWTQYTSYFNDGEPTYFSADTTSPEINGKRDAYYEDDYPLKEAREEVVALLTSFDDETLQAIFGDHKKIEVTKEGIEVEDYSDHG